MKRNKGLSSRSKLIGSPLSTRRVLKRISAKGRDIIVEDERIYEMVFNSRPPYCQECGLPLNEHDFRDENGIVIYRFQYSHILAKKAYPEHRHNPMNFNRLCLEHHQKWEDPYSRKSMKIYGDNIKIISELLNGEEEQG